MTIWMMKSAEKENEKIINDLEKMESQMDLIWIQILKSMVGDSDGLQVKMMIQIMY